MSIRVLVAYASKTGSTAGIAQAIAEELGKMGLQAEARTVEEVEDVGPYSAVVLGSAIYVGKWRKEAVKFAKRHAEELRTKPVWLFDSGPTDTSADEGKSAPVKSSVELTGRLGARGRVTFGGKFTEEQAGPMTRKFIAMGGNTVYGDFRNFERIRKWATEIGEELQGIGAGHEG